MALLQEFAPVPSRFHIPATELLQAARSATIVYNLLVLRTITIEDVSRGYVLSPTIFARDIIAYFIRNRSEFFEANNRWFYVLKKDNPTQPWPIPEFGQSPGDTENIQLPRLYGNLTIEPVDERNISLLPSRTYNIATIGTSLDQGIYVEGDSETKISSIHIQPSLKFSKNTFRPNTPIYGVGGMINSSVPHSSRFGIPKNPNAPFPISYGSNSNEDVIPHNPNISEDVVFIFWRDPPDKRSVYYRNGVPDPSKNNIPFPGIETGTRQWIKIVNETFEASTEDHILVIRMVLQWKITSLFASNAYYFPIFSAICPILRIRLGDFEHQMYLGDVGYIASVSLNEHRRELKQGAMEWPMVIPASTKDQDLTVEVWFPIEEDLILHQTQITNIINIAYNLRSAKSLITESLTWDDITIWPQGPIPSVKNGSNQVAAPITGTAVRVPKGSTLKGTNNLITLPDTWSLSDGFDYLRTADPVWICVDILLRGGIKTSEIDWDSCIQASRTVDRSVGVLIGDVLDVFNELPVKPVFVNGVWKFSTFTIIDVEEKDIQSIPKINISKQRQTLRTVGVSYGINQFVQVTRESNPPGYETVPHFNTGSESAAIKRGREHLWPETLTTLTIFLSNDISILQGDFLVIPGANRRWKVENTKRVSSVIQEVLCSWIDPRRELYIETGSEVPLTDEFIDDWGFLDQHGFVFD